MLREIDENQEIQKAITLQNISIALSVFHHFSFLEVAKLTI